MSEVHEHKNAQTYLSELKVSITTLQNQARTIFSELNALKKERAVLRQQTRDLITQTQQIRKERDTLTAEVKNEKIKRGELNKEVLQKISTVQALGKTDEVQSIGHLKHSIDAINKKIETEVISFEKEKQLMKVLNNLKKQYAAAVKARIILEQKKEVSSTLRTLKKDADVTHEHIQQKAKQSQEKHQLAVTNSQKIDILKKNLDELNLKIEEKDKALQQLEQQLDEKFKELKKISGEVHVSAEEHRKYKHEHEQKILSKKRQDVEAKFKRGEKLTTEDLLVMQSGD